MNFTLQRQSGYIHVEFQLQNTRLCKEEMHFSYGDGNEKSSAILTSQLPVFLMLIDTLFNI